MIWRQIKKLTGQKNIKTSLTELKINDTILQSPIDETQALNYYFVESVDKIAQIFIVQQPYIQTINESDTALVLRPVTKLVVERVVMSLRTSRAKDILSR